MDTMNIIITAFVIIATHWLTKIRSIDIQISISSSKKNIPRLSESSEYSPEPSESVEQLPESNETNTSSEN